MVSTFVSIVDYTQSLLFGVVCCTSKKYQWKNCYCTTGSCRSDVDTLWYTDINFFFHLFFLTRTTDCQKGGTAHGWYSWESPTKTDFIWTTFVLVIQTVEHGLTLEVLCVSSKVCWFRCREDFFSVDLHNFCFQCPCNVGQKAQNQKLFSFSLDIDNTWRLWSLLTIFGQYHYR